MYAQLSTVLIIWSYSNFIDVKWEKEALVPRVHPPPLGVEVFWEGEKGGGSFRLSGLYLT